MLVIIDEYSRFPFVYACKNLKASTIIKKLTDLFCMFGLPTNVHTDQGNNFMSYVFKSWLHSMGVPTGRTTRYNPRGNGQVERYNGIIGKTIVLALRVKKLSLTHWEYVLPNVLHSILRYYALLQIALLTNVCFAMIENPLMVYRCHLG